MKKRMTASTFDLFVSVKGEEMQNLERILIEFYSQGEWNIELASADSRILVEKHFIDSKELMKLALEKGYIYSVNIGEMDLTSCDRLESPLFVWTLWPQSLD